MLTAASPTSRRSGPADSAVRAAAAFLRRLFPVPRPFDVRLWEGTVLPADGEPGFTLAVARPGALRRMFRIPLALSLGEAYGRGDFEIEGDVWTAAPGIQAYRENIRSARDVREIARLWRALPKDGFAGGAVGRARLGAAEGSREWDLKGIRYHYDAGNDIYRLFLGRRMLYSCAYFATGAEDLDAAQELKLEHICRKLRLRPGHRLLDIGCGWGGLVIYAAERFGVRALGVTLSQAQHDLAVRRVAEAGVRDRVEIRIQDYRDLREEPFDRVASVGMFEHVGGPRLPQYFARIFGLMKPGGLFLNHGIGGRVSPGRSVRLAAEKALTEKLVGSAEFRRRYIFPTGDLVSVSEANLPAERAGFEVRDVENLREHYARTLQCWTRNLEANRDEVVRLEGEPKYRLRRIHMGVAAWQFAAGHLTLNQALLAKLDGGRASVPWSRADLYR
ncbi:cyclopropane-fatty-acyl-phospholipid synthase family protein [Longimicrobium sp.]|uniref:cyclopropane-fatty-acyl-phospholipid synthase family protein n=1 Tax=Longimicrobium sp. TaxID=2029185 RepID=UPI002CA7DCD5|nr:cyclopropane-fatty-acyl-phospholipid synthase family protein [Longimicrobium sp.]HSU15111.1 cyclopropane-fatty-acyl-phospholipid synthase family protein [Longimicrobium sp.]